MTSDWLVIIDPQVIFADPGELTLGLAALGLDRPPHRRARR